MYSAKWCYNEKEPINDLDEPNEVDSSEEDANPNMIHEGGGSEELLPKLTAKKIYSRYF